MTNECSICKRVFSIKYTVPNNCAICKRSVCTKCRRETVYYNYQKQSWSQDYKCVCDDHVHQLDPIMSDLYEKLDYLLNYSPQFSRIIDKDFMVKKYILHLELMSKLKQYLYAERLDGYRWSSRRYITPTTILKCNGNLYDHYKADGKTHNLMNNMISSYDKSDGVIKILINKIKMLNSGLIPYSLKYQFEYVNKLEGRNRRYKKFLREMYK